MHRRGALWTNIGHTVWDQRPQPQYPQHVGQWRRCSIICGDAMVEVLDSAPRGSKPWFALVYTHRRCSRTHWMTSYQHTRLTCSAHDAARFRDGGWPSMTNSGAPGHQTHAVRPQISSSRHSDTSWARLRGHNSSEHSNWLQKLPPCSLLCSSRSS
jgi:hypothetical protein